MCINIHLRFINLEININSMDSISLNIAHDVLCHLSIEVSFAIGEKEKKLFKNEGGNY